MSLTATKMGDQWWDMAGVLLGVHLGVLVLFGLSEVLMATWSCGPRACVA